MNRASSYPHYEDNNYCRQNYMYHNNFRINERLKCYLHPILTGKTCKKYVYRNSIDPRNQLIERAKFAVDIYDRFFVQIPGFNKYLERDKYGVFYSSRAADPYVHIFLGFVKNHQKIITHSKTDVSQWNWQDFIRAIRQSNGNGRDMIAKFFAVSSGLRVNHKSDNKFQGRSTDRMQCTIEGIINIFKSVRLSTTDKLFITKFKLRLNRINRPGAVIIRKNGENW